MKNDSNDIDQEIEQAWIEEVDQRAKQVEEDEVKMISQEKFGQMRREKRKPVINELLWLRNQTKVLMPLK